MIRISRVSLAGIILLGFVSQTTAQEPPKPGKEHEHFKKLVGTWTAVSDFGNGSMTYKMELGGLWLVGDFEGEFGGMKFQGKELDTYDAVSKKYKSVWVDSFSTSPRNMEGEMDKTGKIMTLKGEGRGPDGSTMNFKTVTEYKDNDTIGFAMYMVDADGKDQPMVTITYKRKK